ncbi:hypothetical protein MTO96_026717 [Rhipicephalus appendiculatus]
MDGITAKKGPSRRTRRAGVFRPGIETSTSVSVERLVAASQHSGILQNASVTTSLTNRFQQLRLSKMVRVFKRNLSHYSVMPSDKGRRVIIVTYFRAGSNFVGDLLSSWPPTFYHCEPLFMYAVATRLNGRTETKASSLIGHLLRCQLQSANHYGRAVFERKYPFKLHRHRVQFLWTLCRCSNNVCFRPDLVSKLCARAPPQVINVACLHMYVSASRLVAYATQT